MSPPKAFEIHTVEFVFRQSTDRRPCVLVADPIQGKVLVAPISSAIDLFSSTLHFRIEEGNKDFPATGLIKTSYVIGDQLREVELSDLKRRAG
jgi:hypothetical protein